MILNIAIEIDGLNPRTDDPEEVAAFFVDGLDSDLSDEFGPSDVQVTAKLVSAEWAS